MRRLETPAVDEPIQLGGSFGKADTDHEARYQEEEGEKGGRRRNRPHQIDFQQYDRDHHRPAGERDFVGEPRGDGIQGIPPRAPRSPRQQAADRAAREVIELGMRKVECWIKGPGAGREAAIRSLKSAGARRHGGQGRDADPAQRLPSEKETESLTTHRR